MQVAGATAPTAPATPTWPPPTVTSASVWPMWPDAPPMTQTGISAGFASQIGIESGTGKTTASTGSMRRSEELIYFNGIFSGL